MSAPSITTLVVLVVKQDSSSACLHRKFRIVHGPSYYSRLTCKKNWFLSLVLYVLSFFSFTSGKATKNSQFGNVTSSFIFTEVTCVGTEQSLLDCTGDCNTNCGQAEAAGVICQGLLHSFNLHFVIVQLGLGHSLTLKSLSITNTHHQYKLFEGFRAS